MNAKLDLTFPHRYDVEELREPPFEIGNDKRMYYPAGSECGGADGLLVRFGPHGRSAWLGVFAFGYPSSNALTGIHSCPDERSVCVVSAGKGYIVRTDDPKIWQEVAAFPILDARAIATRRLLVFADFTRIVAHGSEGQAWISSRLSSDGLRILEVTDNHIKGTGWDAAKNRELEFLLNVETGQHVVKQDLD